MSDLFHRFFRDRVQRGLNKEVATRNLFDFSDLLGLSDVAHFLAFGTLLGAVRDRDFIPHDTDTDLATFADCRNNVRQLCRSKLFRSYGFRILRQRSELVSIARDDEHIDLYMFEKSGSDYCCMQYKIQGPQLTHGFGTIVFLGREFNTVKDPEADLTWRYGEDWRIPKRGFHAPF